MTLSIIMAGPQMYNMSGDRQNGDRHGVYKSVNDLARYRHLVLQRRNTCIQVE